MNKKATTLIRSLPKEHREVVRDLIEIAKVSYDDNMAFVRATKIIGPAHALTVTNLLIED